MEQELAELRLSVLQGLCHNHGLNYTGLTKSQMAAIIAQHTRTHHPGQSDSDIVLELEREHSVSSLLTPQIGEELNLHLATSEDLEAEAAVQVASPDPLDDPIMDLYRSRLVILGADLTSAERLKLLELTMQESQGRTSHCWKAHQQGAGPEIPKHVVKLMHAAFPSFNEGKESIDAYLRTFEIMCEDYEVPKTEWTKILEAKLVGKARDVYRETPYTQQTNYDEVKGVLFNNYAISPETYLHTFRALTKDPTDTHWVFANCLQHTFDQWLKSSGVQSLEDLRQLCLMEQFLELCSPDIRKWVWDRSPDTLEEAARLADKYVESRGQLLQGLPVLTSLSTSAYTPKLSTGHSQTNFTSPSPNGIPAQDLHHRNKMCFRCGSDSHLQATCQLPPRASKLKQPQHVALVTTEMVETPFHPVQAVQHHTQDCASKNMLTSQPIGEYIVMGVQQADQMKHPRHAPTQESNLQNCNVYVGNLGQHGNKAVLEHAFGLYGPLRRIWVAQKPPGFAFVEFEDPHDAATAVQGLNGKTLCGSHVKVELSIRQRHSKHITMCQLAPETKNYRLNQNSSGFLNFSQSVTPSVCGPLPTEGSPINALPLGEEPCGCVKNIGGIDLMSF